MATCAPRDRRDPLTWLAATLGLVSTVYLAAGILWSSSDVAFPFGPEHDPRGRDQSLLGSVAPAAAWPYVVGLALVGVLTAGRVAQPRPGRVRGALVVGSAAAQGVLYAVIVPDGRPLVAAAHVPILLIGKPFDWPPGVTIGSQLPWPVVHQLLMMAVGTGWLIAALGHARIAGGRCVRCGRGQSAARWAQRDAVRRWGRWAVGVAMAAPALYASSRLAWALDIPYGVTREWLEDMRADEPTIFVGGAAIAMLGLAGATLTFGLVARWGERWPRWVPGLRGGDLPVGVAILPATSVAILLISAGKQWFVSAALGHLPEEVLGENWATVVFGATLPIWGIALAAAVYAYWLRRRGPCPRCGVRTGSGAEAPRGPATRHGHPRP